MKPVAPSIDTMRSAHLLFSAELARGRIGEAQLADPRVASAVAPCPFASRSKGALQRLAMKLGQLDYERRCLAPAASARHAVLGDDAVAPPRLLVRVDEFPHPSSYSVESRSKRRGTHDFKQFHSIMRSNGVPYLLAVTPRVADDYLDPRGQRDRPLDDAEAEALSMVARDGVEMALHGYNHRTRRRSPQQRSELCGLEVSELSDLLDRALAGVAEVGLAPGVFVPPFNRFDTRQYTTLAARFHIVCGGPESVPLLGFHRTPQWRGEAVYLPAYPPMYGRASDILPAVERLVAAQPGVWVPVVLHWSWEAEDGWRALHALAKRMASIAAEWSEFREASAAARSVGSDAAATGY